MFGSPEDMTLFIPNVTFFLFCCVGLETTMYRPGAKPRQIRPGEQKTSRETTRTASEDEKYEVCFKKVGPVY